MGTTKGRALYNVRVLFNGVMPLSSETVLVPEGDVIIGFEINHGWVIDRLVFVTRKGLRLGPFGTSEGGNFTVGNVADYAKTPDIVPVSLHGISYSEILSQKQYFWNEVIFHFSTIDENLVKLHGPVWADVHKMLRNKEFLL